MRPVIGAMPNDIETEMDDVAVELLLEAGVAMAESLDMEGTLGRVARLTVPRLADLCVIDLLDEDGSIRQMAVASADANVARRLRELRERQQLDPQGEHPVARVIRSGEPELRAEMTSLQLRSFAAGSEHARFMLDSGYHSAVVAPLLARQRTLGALSVLRLVDGQPYTPADLALVSELARRAALAIDNARLFSAVRRVEQRLEAVLVNLAEAITLTDAHDQIVFANHAAARLLGAQEPQELIGVRQEELMHRFVVQDEHGRELSAQEMPRRRLFAGGAPEPLLLKVVVRASGEEHWLLARPGPVTDPETGRVLFVVNVYEDITEVKRTQLAERFMAEASRMLASSMDYAETLTRIAELAVPQIADWCAVDVLSESGEIERVAIHHGDPAKIALAERLEQRYHAPLDAPVGIPEVIRSGRVRMFTDLTPEVLAAYASDREHLELLSAFEATAMIIAPMSAPTRTVGAITLISSRDTRRLTQADVGLAERLGRRAGTAVESARLYTERTRIAHILQAALLPESLPTIAGAEVATLYHAAGELNDVGGDFYDLVPYGPERWLMAIGDVCGKGPRAAGVTALARHTMRTAAMLGQTPVGILQTLHRALSGQPVGADLCTVCLVTVECTTTGPVQLTVTLAGHPQPLLIGVDGDAELIGEPGTLLGVLDPIEVHEASAELKHGETLLLYTDGLPESGHAGAQLGERRLMEVCAQAPRLSLDGLLAEIERTALAHADGTLRDDIALMALRLSQPGDS
jgi:PAS domain S-box-containing protein